MNITAYVALVAACEIVYWTLWHATKPTKPGKISSRYFRFAN